VSAAGFVLWAMVLPFGAGLGIAHLATSIGLPRGSDAWWAFCVLWDVVAVIALTAGRVWLLTRGATRW
jgi:hypothetical protein